MNIGDAFLMSVAPRHIPHLYFVISDKNKNSGTFIIVNITGDRFRSGKECVLNLGDHPWIKKESFVSFADALEINPSNYRRIQRLIVQKKIKLQPSLRPEILAKIVDAAKESDAIPENFKKHL
jgi:hypothetical protein